MILTNGGFRLLDEKEKCYIYPKNGFCTRKQRDIKKIEKKIIDITNYI